MFVIWVWCPMPMTAQLLTRQITCFDTFGAPVQVYSPSDPISYAAVGREACIYILLTCRLSHGLDHKYEFILLYLN
jgi:hypothetical protein